MKQIVCNEPKNRAKEVKFCIRFFNITNFKNDGRCVNQIIRSHVRAWLGPAITLFESLLFSKLTRCKWETLTRFGNPLQNFWSEFWTKCLKQCWNNNVSCDDVVFVSFEYDLSKKKLWFEVNVFDFNRLLPDFCWN